MPKFKSEDEEREFWATHDFADYQDQFEAIELDSSKLKSSTESIFFKIAFAFTGKYKITC